MSPRPNTTYIVQPIYAPWNHRRGQRAWENGTDFGEKHVPHVKQGVHSLTHIP